MEYTVLTRKAPDGFYIATSPLIPEARAQGKTYEDCSPCGPGSGTEIVRKTG